jgi:hypothetical protein
MNIIQRAIDAVRHPGEYPNQRARRRWMATLDRTIPAPMAVPQRRVDVVCRCGHTYSQHVVVSAAQATCGEEDTCIMFRPDRVVVT